MSEYHVMWPRSLASGMLATRMFGLHPGRVHIPAPNWATCNCLLNSTLYMYA